jgi:hypothetical protein
MRALAHLHKELLKWLQLSGAIFIVSEVYG